MLADAPEDCATFFVAHNQWYGSKDNILHENQNEKANLLLKGAVYLFLVNFMAILTKLCVLCSVRCMLLRWVVNLINILYFCLQSLLEFYVGVY